MVSLEELDPQLHSEKIIILVIISTRSIETLNPDD